MGTEILRPQDFFNDQIRVSPSSFFRQKLSNGNSNHRSNRKPLTRPDRSNQRRISVHSFSRPAPEMKSPVAGYCSDMYAGSAFSMSPSPSSLPLPSFSKRKSVLPIVDDSATKDLRRLLRLDE